MALDSISVFDSKINAAPKKLHSFYATRILAQLLGGSSWFGVGVDTVRIIIEVRRHDALMLRSLGFRRQKRRIIKAVATRKHTPIDTYFLNIETPNETIKLHWTICPKNRHWLSVECSLPKLMTGSNFDRLENNSAAIDELSGVVSMAINKPVNLWHGHFSRLDIFLNLPLQTSDNIKLAVAALRYLEVSRRNQMPARYKTTVEWQNYGSKLTHVLQIYDKTKKARADGFNVPNGILRIETRYNDTTTLERNLKNLGIENSLEMILETSNLERLFEAHLPA